jgi:hypothetical protein
MKKILLQSIIALSFIGNVSAVEAKLYYLNIEVATGESKVEYLASFPFHDEVDDVVRSKTQEGDKVLFTLIGNTVTEFERVAESGHNWYCLGGWLCEGSYKAPELGSVTHGEEIVLIKPLGEKNKVRFSMDYSYLVDANPLGTKLDNTKVLSGRPKIASISFSQDVELSNAEQCIGDGVIIACFTPVNSDDI